MFFIHLIKQLVTYFTSPKVQTGDDQANTLVGTYGNDQLDGLGAGDTLIGKKGRDVLNGGTGNDLLNGGAGADKLNGGEGTDTITYEDSCAGVTVNLETGLAQGGDAQGDVFTSIENVTGSAYKDKLLGDAGNNVLNGLGGNDELSGGIGDDRLIGGTGKDTLWGGEGNDHLIGDTGTDADYKSGAADTLYGGDGNDTYSVYQTGDQVVENANEGNDIVLASVDYTLSANVENLSMFGSAVRGTGNDLNNKITGSAGDNIINGKAGHDDLVGNGGSDTFVFETADAASSDVVRDFRSGDDKIAISVSGFGLDLQAGAALPSDYLVFDASKPANADPLQTEHGQFILVQDNATTTSLHYDADGGLPGGSVLVATFIGTPSVSLADITLVA